MGLMLLFVEVLGLKDSIAYIPMAVISAVTNYLVIRTVVKYTKKKREKQQS
jgi:MFS superfamily sulfate permease-like transporter